VPSAVRFDQNIGIDKRINAKISWLTGHQNEYLQTLAETGMFPPGRRIHVHDSFAVIAPRYHDAVDTHHYINSAAGNMQGSPHKCGAYVGAPDNWLRAGATCPFGARVGNSVGVSDAIIMLNGVCNRDVAAPK